MIMHLTQKAISVKLPYMLRLDQIRRELKAISEFSLLFESQSTHYSGELIGETCREMREQELLALAESLASRN